MPERLLSMAPAEIAIVPGVGKISLGEIIRYRVWHLEIPPMPAEEHQPGCFALEEEKGGGWQRSGAMGPAH